MTAIPSFDASIPETPSPEEEFISLSHLNPSTELNPVPALVGSPETVTAAILDYVDRGASLVSIRGYDTLADAVHYGRHVLPLVREELAHRRTSGQRGTLQAEHLGNYGPRYGGYATAQAGVSA